MIDESLSTMIFPASNWPWVGIALILSAAVVSVTLIALTTQRAIRGMAVAARQALAAAPAPSKGTTPAIESVGRGDVTWHDGGFTLRATRRAVTAAQPEAEDALEDALTVLIGKMCELGIDTRDIIEGETEVVQRGDAYVASLGIQILVRDPTLVGTIGEQALAAGFTEDRSAGREEITLEDAHATAVQRAIDDALQNTTSLAAVLGISRTELGMLGAKLETVHVPGDGAGRIIKIAKTSWGHPGQSSKE